MLNHIPDPLGANLNSNVYTIDFFPIYYKGGNRFNNLYLDNITSHADNSRYLTIKSLVATEGNGTFSLLIRMCVFV